MFTAVKKIREKYAFFMVVFMTKSKVNNFILNTTKDIDLL